MVVNEARGECLLNGPVRPGYACEVERFGAGMIVNIDLLNSTQKSLFPFVNSLGNSDLLLMCTKRYPSKFLKTQ